jgi:mono/diheme cytochrome c family protein
MKTSAFVRLTALCTAALLWGCGSSGASSERAPTEEDAGAWTPPVVIYPDGDAGAAFALSQTGLYRDIAKKQLAPDLLAFEPAFALWSDAAEKRRWLRLPQGTVIDTSDADHWQFPIGTMLFKEFAKDGKRLETRLIARTGAGPNDYFMGAFIWNDDESDALFVSDGQRDVRGTAHDVPSEKNCGTCHNGEPGRVLGFSAVQQPAVRSELLTIAVAPFTVPGSEAARAAFGYLHANCAHCHNPNGSARPDTNMNLRLALGETRAEDTQILKTTVGIDLQNSVASQLEKRVVARAPAESALLFRMLERGPETQMPPLATESVDPAGTAAVRAWIESL